MLTSIGGIAGACLALTANVCAKSGPSMTLILAFTAGGFINIALVQVLPELQHKCMTSRYVSTGSTYSNPHRESLRHVVLVVLGMAVMGAVNLCHTA